MINISTPPENSGSLFQSTPILPKSETNNSPLADELSRAPVPAPACSIGEYPSIEDNIVFPHFWDEVIQQTHYQFAYESDEADLDSNESASSNYSNQKTSPDVMATAHPEFLQFHADFLQSDNFAVQSYRSQCEFESIMRDLVAAGYDSSTKSGLTWSTLLTARQK